MSICQGSWLAYQVRPTGILYSLYASISRDEWWDDPQKVIICQENQKTLTYLKTIPDFNIVIIDKSSKGNGWREKRHGVGWARKTLMDAINAVAEKTMFIVSLDADTSFSENYFRNPWITTFQRFPECERVIAGSLFS